MICPFCNFKDTKVIDKRDQDDLSITRRRRECLNCSKRFTTYERMEKLNLRVVKKDGVLQEYDREKILHGISVATQKRVAHEDIEKMAEEIETEVMSRNVKVVSSSDIGRIILKKLLNVDKIAYMRFASVFLDFSDMDEFKKEVDKLC